jgi:hypothetical protein
MKNTLTIAFFAITTSLQAQQITGSSLFSPTPGGARILSGQGNTAANPAIGFQSSVSTPTTAENDGGGGLGIFRPLANIMAFSTTSQERMRIGVSGQVSIGTTLPLARLTVETTTDATGIKANGINTGVYGEATIMNQPLTAAGTLAGWKEAIGVFGNGNYANNTGNGNIYGVVGSASATNPLNNIGVYGESKNATGYNTGVYGEVNTTVGIYNTGVGGKVALDSNATWNRAIAGYAPVANKHYAGYFDGNVDMQSGTVRIGNVTTPVGYKLYVEKGILTEKVKVALASSAAWADYVFAPDYKLETLDAVETYIKENNHLPNIPSAEELAKDGLNLGDMQAKQMEKIEELTLYLIEMKKEINALKSANNSLQSQINSKN